MNLAWKWIGTFGILATQCGGGLASELSEQADSRPDKGGIDCIGAAFFLEFEGFPYLITARHVAEDVEAIHFSYALIVSTGLPARRRRACAK